MDAKHRLDAPDNDSLSLIEQVSDHSELSSIYPHAGKQWEGDLVSTAERERRRQEKEDTMTFGIRKKAWKVGLLGALPLTLLSIFIAGAITGVAYSNINVMLIPIILLLLLWATLTFNILKKFFALFYDNGLRAGPFLVVLFILLALSIEIIYTLTVPLHGEKLLAASFVVGGIILLWSMAISTVMLLIWTTHRLNSSAKMGLVGLFALSLLIASGGIYLFL